MLRRLALVIGVIWLSSPLASYVTGATLVLHGGGERPAFLDARDG